MIMIMIMIIMMIIIIMIFLWWLWLLLWLLFLSSTYSVDHYSTRITQSTKSNFIFFFHTYCILDGNDIGSSKFSSFDWISDKLATQE